MHLAEKTPAGLHAIITIITLRSPSESAEGISQLDFMGLGGSQTKTGGYTGGSGAVKWWPVMDKNSPH